MLWDQCIGPYSTLCASGVLNKGKSLEWGLREEKGRVKVDGETVGGREGLRGVG